MLGSQEKAEPSHEERGDTPAANRQSLAPGTDPCEINPRSVVEAMLFVGRPDDRPFSAREMAAAMRGCSPNEIDAAVTELNEIYQRDGAPYAIVGTSNGYRLAVRDELRAGDATREAEVVVELRPAGDALVGVDHHGAQLGPGGEDGGAGPGGPSTHDHHVHLHEVVSHSSSSTRRSRSELAPVFGYVERRYDLECA